MTPEQMLAHCLDKPGAWADNPWGHEHPVVKVHDKIYAFIGADGVGVKSGVNREIADEWLERYPEDASVMRYIGRSGWNDLRFNGAIADDELCEACDESYALVVGKLAKKHRPPGLGRPIRNCGLSADRVPQMRLVSGHGDVPHQAGRRAARGQ